MIVRATRFAFWKSAMSCIKASALSIFEPVFTFGPSICFTYSWSKTAFIGCRA